MALALVTALAACLWVFLWAVGVSSFDALLLSGTIILIAGGIIALREYLPNQGK